MLSNLLESREECGSQDRFACLFAVFLSELLNNKVQYRSRTRRKGVTLVGGDQIARRDIWQKIVERKGSV